MRSFRFLKLFEDFLLEDFDFLNKERKYNSLFSYIQAVEEKSDDQMENLYIQIRDKNNTLKSRKTNIHDTSTYPEQVQNSVPEGRWRLKIEEPKEDKTKGAVPLKEDKAPTPDFKYRGEPVGNKGKHVPVEIRTLISPDGEEFVDKDGRFKDVKFNKKGWPMVQHLIGKRIPTYENITDLLDIMELVEITNKFIKLMPSHIRTEMKLRQDELSDLLVHYKDYRDYKENFLLKANRYRTVDEFLQGLKGHIDGFKTKDKIVQKINENPNMDIVFFQRDVLIAVVYNYEGSNAVGSTSWCISYSEDYWDQYVTDHARAQYFIWDFNKSNTDNSSMIGATVKDNNTLHTAHYKNDNRAHIDDMWWVDKLIGMRDLDMKYQIKYAVNNLKVEKKFGIISKLSVEERREWIFKFPQLIQYVSMDGIDTDDIIKLIDTDNTILEFETIGSRLKDIPKEKMLGMVEGNLDLMKYQPVNNWIHDQLSNDEKIALINGDDRIWDLMLKDKDLALYTFLKDKLSGEEMSNNFDLMRTLRFPSLFLKVPDHLMRDAYRGDTNKWDSEVTNIGDRKLKFKTKVWKKDDERMEYERTHELYVFNAIVTDTGEVNDNQEKIYDAQQIGEMTMIDPNNQDDHQEINMLKMRARFKGNIFTFGVWVDKEYFDSKPKVAGKALEGDDFAGINKTKFLV